MRSGWHKWMLLLLLVSSCLLNPQPEPPQFTGDGASAAGSPGSGNSGGALGVAGSSVSSGNDSGGIGSLPKPGDAGKGGTSEVGTSEGGADSAGEGGADSAGEGGAGSVGVGTAGKGGVDGG